MKIGAYVHKQPIIITIIIISSSSIQIVQTDLVQSSLEQLAGFDSIFQYLQTDHCVSSRIVVVVVTVAVVDCLSLYSVAFAASSFAFALGSCSLLASVASLLAFDSFVP